MRVYRCIIFGEEEIDGHREGQSLEQGEVDIPLEEKGRTIVYRFIDIVCFELRGIAVMGILPDLWLKP